MADFATDATRIDSGKALLALEKQGINAINQLKNVKINIVDLKNEVSNNDIYTPEDVAKVQEIINYLLAEIETI
jgi:hypothetical protein